MCLTKQTREMIGQNGLQSLGARFLKFATKIILLHHISVMTVVEFYSKPGLIQSFLHTNGHPQIFFDEL